MNAIKIFKFFKKYNKINWKYYNFKINTILEEQFPCKYITQGNNSATLLTGSK